MSPAEEEKSLPLPERWPRASKFALSACAAAVAELGTTHCDFLRGKGVKIYLWGAGGTSVPGHLVPRCSLRLFRSSKSVRSTLLVVTFQ